MNQTIRTRQFYTVNVISASPSASPILLSIAGTLGIDPGQAKDRLSSLPAVLAENVTAQEARRISALLGAFGFRVRLDPVSAFQKIGRFPGQRRDLALQPLRDFDPLTGARRLAQAGSARGRVPHPRQTRAPHSSLIETPASLAAKGPHPVARAVRLVFKALHIIKWMRHVSVCSTFC